jgi:exodeoxyribonuclease VII large subunit
MDLNNHLERETHIFSVSELTREIKILLETNIPYVWLVGEISNFTHHSSGHMYFSVKDQDAQISCVIWRTRNTTLLFSPHDGMKVMLYGCVRLYEKRGTYQFDIARMIPAGVGELQIAFEQLKARLREEGLFDDDHKKPIPAFPEKVGVITSPTGAAVQDIMHILRRRFPPVQIVLRPAQVQGENAAQDIAAAIDEFNEFGNIDVMIVGRGGGSLEDLWPFNEEAVARAIYRSAIPVVSAVGHETDFSISDFVADLRAPTPSAAAELVVPDQGEVLNHVHHLDNQNRANVSFLINTFRDQLKRLQSSYGFRRPADIISQYRQRIDDLFHSGIVSLNHQLTLESNRLAQVQKQLAGLHPNSILKRGYSICYRRRDNTVIRQAQQVRKSELIHVQFFQGSADGQVVEVFNDEH